MVELRPERGRECSGKEPITGVPVLEALPLLRAEVEIEGGRGRPVVESSRFIERSFVRELVRVSASGLRSSPLMFFGSLFDLVARSVSARLWDPPFTCGTEVVDVGLSNEGLCWWEFCRARADVERAIGATRAGLCATLLGWAKVPTTGEEAILGDPAVELTVPALFSH